MNIFKKSCGHKTSNIVEKIEKSQEGLQAQVVLRDVNSARLMAKKIQEKALLYPFVTR